jgi:hypothetical protein
LRGVNALQPESSLAYPASSGGALGGGSSGGDGRLAAARRFRALARIGERALDGCLGARACVWFARLSGFSFAVSALLAARPLPGTLEAILRLALVSLSWCAGLAALSAAGPAPERLLLAGRGLWQNRGITAERAQMTRPLASVTWILRHVGSMALLVSAVCVGVSSEPWRAARLLGAMLGSLGYVAMLALGLALLARLCNVLGRGRGQSLLLALVFIPELIAPVWPELPTVVSSYARLLDACLSAGARL